MATILNDIELQKLFGTIILRGEDICLRPNSYILRVGQLGEYLNTNKRFSINKKEEKKGVSIPPGHSVGLISYEDIDFRRETVHKIFPDCDLHAFITPTTNLSREGIVAPATQIDAGWNGTLNWTVVNTSSQKRNYLHKSKAFRMTVLKLSGGEVPENPYDGHYQEQFGYVKSKRHDAPVGMDETEWETAYIKGGPENLLEILATSGPPWNALATRFKIIDDKFEVVTDEYSEIKNMFEELKEKVNNLSTRQESIFDQVGPDIEKVLKKQIPFWENRWTNKLGKVIVSAIGIILLVTSYPTAMSLLRENGILIGLLLILGSILFHFVTRNK